jgi:hypothetical protein
VFQRQLSGFCDSEGRGDGQRRFCHRGFDPRSLFDANILAQITVGENPHEYPWEKRRKDFPEMGRQSAGTAQWFPAAIRSATASSASSISCSVLMMTWHCVGISANGGKCFILEAASSMTAQSQVRGRILELVHYLQSIQAK